MTRAEFVPQWFDVARGRVVDLDSVIEAGAGAGVTAVRDRIREIVLSRGAAQDGLVTGR
ncbi:putative lipoprotein [Streptomyces scabiei 87.22]|uniref:Putative lipoprotein n=1 Tax=Streptomyces scabiei (strain 87.22) TaxID=680198 RepID=C9Z524_STRSW|nr:putative lipoprotein [Streptomyces scabiei 87.22]